MLKVAVWESLPKLVLTVAKVDSPTCGGSFQTMVGIALSKLVDGAFHFHAA